MRPSDFELLERRRLLSGLPTMSIGDVWVTEGDAGTTTAALVVSLSQPRPNQPVTVNYVTQDGTAVAGAGAGADYVAASGKVTFAVGEMNKTILLSVRGDHSAENDEYFVVNLQGAKQAKIGDGQGIVTIADDEPRVSIVGVDADEGDSGTTPFSFIATLSRASDQAVTVNYATQDGSAIAGTDYQAASGTVTFAAGQTSKPIPIQVIGDRLAEADTYFSVNLSGASANAAIGNSQGFATILDDEPRVSIVGVDAAEGDSGTTTFNFTATLSRPSDQPVTVHYATQDGSALAGTDYQAASGTVTFPACVTSMPIPVQVIGDLLGEADKYFSVNLSGVSANAAISESEGIATILDNEPRITISGYADYEGDSGTKDFIFSVNLSRAYGQEVTVNYATGDYTAFAGTDYVATSGTLTFAPGDTAKTITVQVVGNTTPEPEKYFFVELSGASANVSVSYPSAYGVIYDDDGYYYDPGYYDPGYYDPGYSDYGGGYYEW